MRENIKELDYLNNLVTQSIIQLKNIFEKINNKKEEMKIEVLKIFNKIRSELNNREDQLIYKIN